MRLAVVSCLSLLLALALSSRASADQSLAISFTGIETGELSAWDAGRTRFRIWLQADSCIRTTNKTRRAPLGEMNLTLAVSPAGKATKVTVTGSTAILRKAATCLQRALRNSITFLPAPSAYVWKSKLRVGAVPDGITVSIMSLESNDLTDRMVFESIFTTQIERAACLPATLEPGISAALHAELTLTPGAATVAKVTPSTHVPGNVAACLEPMLATKPSAVLDERLASLRAIARNLCVAASVVRRADSRAQRGGSALTRSVRST